MITSRLAETARRNADEALATLQMRRVDSAASRELITALGPAPTTAHREGA
jgi:hypothetical protein